jgi:hypothetical protein
VTAVGLRVRATLRRRWQSTLVVAFIVAVASGTVLTLVAGARRTASAPDAYTASVGGNADALIEQDQGRPLTSQVAALPGVTSVQAMTFTFAGIPEEDGTQPQGTLAFAGTRPYGSRVIAGRETDPTRPHEFVAEKGFVESRHAHVGDSFHVISWSRQQADKHQGYQGDPKGASFEGVLVGVLDSPSKLEDGYNVIIFSPALLDEDVGIVATITAVHLDPGVASSRLRAELDTLPAGRSLQVQAGTVISTNIRNAVGAQAEGTWIMAAVAALAALIALGQVLTRHSRLADIDRRPLIAVGFTRRQEMAESLARAAVPVAIGVALGAVIAIVASGIFPAGFVRTIEPHSGVRVDVTALLLGGGVLLVGMLAWVTVALFAVRPARRTRSRSATSDAIAKRAPSATSAVGARFALTTRGGSAVGTLVTLALIVAGIVGTTGFAASLDRLVTDRARFGTNFAFGVGDNTDLHTADLKKAFAGDGDISAMMILTGDTARAGDTTVGIVGVEHVRGDLSPVVLSGRMPSSPDELALGRLTARDLHLHAGSRLELAGAKGTGSYLVVGLTVVPTIGGIDGVGNGAVMTAEGLQRVSQDPPTTTMAGIALRPGAPSGTATRLAARVGQQAGLEDLPGVIVNVSRVRRIPAFLAALLGGLLLLTMFHAVIVSIQARRRDLAVLGALGADRGWIGRAVHWQTTVLAALPLLIGVPLGVVAGSVVFRTFTDRIGAVPDPAIPFLLITVAVGALLVVANVVAVVPTRRARRLSTAQRLLSE